MKSPLIIICFQATAYHAQVEGESFKKTGDYGFARATETMNSKCSNDFRWSVRITASAWMVIGIASKLQQTDDLIFNYDENSILYSPYYENIYKGKNIVRNNIIKAKTGDELHFRFQPKLKKFRISIVS